MKISNGGRNAANDSNAGEKKQQLKRQSPRAIDKGEITNTEFPEGGNTICTKDPRQPHERRVTYTPHKKLNNKHYNCHRI